MLLLLVRRLRLQYRILVPCFQFQWREYVLVLLDEVKLFLGVAPEIPIYLVDWHVRTRIFEFRQKIEDVTLLPTFIIIQHQPFVIRVYPE